MAATSIQHDTFVQRARAFDQLRHQVPALARLEPASVDRLLELTKVRLYTRNSVVAAPGRAPTHVFGVLHGMLVERTHGGGIVREIARRGPGTFAGLSALLDQEPTLFETFAVDHTQVLEFDAVGLAQMRAAFHPVALQFSQALMPLVVGELHAMHRRVVVIASHKNMDLRGSPA
jgi:CRP-like cAMP-binding protein